MNPTVDLPTFVIKDTIKQAAASLASSVKASQTTRARIAEYMEQHNVSEELAP